MAHFGQSGMSPDGTVAYATVTFDGRRRSTTSTPTDLETPRTSSRPRTARTASTVGANGVFAFVGGEPPSSESIGVMVALVILLFAFGVDSRGLPADHLRGPVGVADDGFVLPLVAAYFDVATFAPILASMIGLGVGIDYSLFVINRYREAMIHGREPRTPRSSRCVRPAARCSSQPRR